MAHLTVQAIGEALNPVAFGAAASGGDTVSRVDNSFLVVKNCDSAPHTVTLDTPGKTHGLDIADEAVVVAAGSTAYIATSDSIFVHSSDNLIHVAYSAVPARTVTDGVTNTDTSLTSATAAFTSADVGRAVTGAGIPANTVISSVTSSTAVVLSKATTATATGVSVTITSVAVAQVAV